MRRKSSSATEVVERHQAAEAEQRLRYPEIPPLSPPSLSLSLPLSWSERERERAREKEQQSDQERESEREKEKSVCVREKIERETKVCERERERERERAREGCLSRTATVEGQPWVPVGSTVGPRFLAGIRGQFFEMEWHFRFLRIRER